MVVSNVATDSERAGGGRPSGAAAAALEALELARSESTAEVMQAAVDRLGLVHLEALANDAARVASYDWTLSDER
jgi:hypothetical protein